METNDQEEMKGLKYGLQQNTERKAYTIQEAVNTVGNGWFQLWAGIVCGLVWIADAIALLLLAVMAVVLRCEWQLTVFQSSMITTMPFLCQIIGAYVWGICSDKYGRKSILFLTTALVFWFSVLSAFSTNIEWFLVCRCISTFMVGASAQAITFLMEFLPTQKRGVFVAVFELSFSSGVVLSVVLAMLLIPTLGWRYYLVFCSLPTLLACLFLLTLSESPYYHASIGAADKVNRTFQTIAKWNNKELVQCGIRMEIQEDHGSFWDLFATADLAKSSLLLSILWICTGVGYYGMVLLTAEALANGNACQEFGGNEESCSDYCKPFDTEGYVGMIIVAVAELPSVVLCILLIDIIGRRALLIFASLSFTCCFSLLFFCFEQQAITTSILFASKCFIQIDFLVLFAYTPEIYPTPVRGLALGAGVAVSRIGTALAPLFAQVLASYSVMASVVVITVAGVGAIVASLLLPVETKGQQIQSSIQDSRYRATADGDRDKDS